MTIDQAFIDEAGYEWARTYETVIQPSRLRREFKELTGEDKTLLMKSFKAYVKETPAKYFSWNKFRDTWKAWIPKEGPSPEEIFDAIIASPTGYTPNSGSYWSLIEIRNKHGFKVAEAVEKTGGTKFGQLTKEERGWRKAKFVKEYGAK